MREIKFRGRDEHGDWHYGAFMGVFFDGVVAPIEYANIYDDGMANRVLPDTVGQFTGLTDSEGREIYEGDVIRSVMLPHMRTAVCNGCVVYRNGAFYVEYIDHTYANLGDLIFYSGTSSTVIGNIHDNPDLLEKQP